MVRCGNESMIDDLPKLTQITTQKIGNQIDNRYKVDRHQIDIRQTVLPELTQITTKKIGRQIDSRQTEIDNRQKEDYSYICNKMWG